MSFKDRVRKSKDGRKGFVFPTGSYSARFVDSKFGKSKNGDDMFTLNFKFLSVVALDDKKVDVDELVETVKDNGKKFEIKLLTRLGFQFDRLLEFLSDAGMDLETCDEKDKKFTDIKKLLSELEELRPKVTIVVKENADDHRYRNYYLNEVEVVGDCDPSEDDEDDEEEAPAPRKSKAKPPVVEDDEEEVPVKKSKIKPVLNDDGDSYDDLISDGWTHKQIAKQYPELV